MTAAATNAKTNASLTKTNAANPFAAAVKKKNAAAKKQKKQLKTLNKFKTSKKTPEGVFFDVRTVGTRR